ncbi:MAG: recombinase family protein [Candidatus Angelobacter sp. Gp1-AA117]|nr:MAG: recombinase family protein [Candidatus Angelobacter sp. Gp1-AA117]
MKNYLAYTRVSTAKQGEHGVSLQEQKAAIENYAHQNQLVINEWFEEQETAAMKGRPIFTKMLRLLRSGKASGVVIHKIDRSARNLKDWADLQELSEQGIEVHFASEAIVLNTRGNRLLADIQAVVAADFIRNLREETRKGIRGRLRQGLYPRPAPLGYVDVAPGKPKAIDPVSAPFVKKAFESYATGDYNLKTLATMLHNGGFRARSGGKLNPSNFSRILNNPFYAGIIKIKNSGETFAGLHTPIVSKSLFDEVQSVLTGKKNAKLRKHDFVFRRLVVCGIHNRCLVPERHTTKIYYRCHAGRCPSSVPESSIERAITGELRRLQFSLGEQQCLKLLTGQIKADSIKQRQEVDSVLQIQSEKINERLNRLTDAYLDRAIDKVDFEQRKTALIIERREIERRREEFRQMHAPVGQYIEQFLELARSAYLLYESADLNKKREIVKLLSSKIVASSKSVDFMLCLPFKQIAERDKMLSGCPPSATCPQICDKLLDFLKVFCATAQVSLLERFKAIMPETPDDVDNKLSRFHKPAVV